MGGPCLVDGVSRHELDNFGICSFEYNGKTYASAEHAFQAAKFTDEAHCQKIRQAPSGGDAWSLGNTREVPIRKDWENVKVKVMYEVNLAKFSQNPMLCEALVATKGPIIAFGFPFWAKWNAVLLERIREELRPSEQRDTTLLSAHIAVMEDVGRTAHGEGGKSDGTGGSGALRAAQGGVPFSPELLASLNN
mmetsp:Transcript_76384/g.127254  ORF Transcript_76384/g.127254 Transcript_76384/m.127254 type:complete len:192 (-) Transcript_76384:487-1062(-)